MKQSKRPDRPEPPKRTVRPIKLHHDRSTLYAVDVTDGALLKEDGELLNLDTLPSLMRKGRGVIATNRPNKLLAWLIEQCGDDPLFQCRITDRKLERITLPSGVEIQDYRHIKIGFVGFTTPKKDSANNYWHILDPTLFLNNNLDKSRSLTEVMEWAGDILNWCVKEGIRPKSTAGGLAAQLLKHPRFYSEPRRRIPTATNERVRSTLRGNHYETRAIKGKVYLAADEFDQRSAHHFHAQRAQLPDSDVRAVGFFYQEDILDKPYCGLSDLMGKYGVVYCRYLVPDRRVYKSRWKEKHLEFRPQFATGPSSKGDGSRLGFICTNEIPYLYEIGGSIQYVCAGWLSTGKDTGLNEYAKWAQSEVAESLPLTREWLKPTLLASYGLLATNPSYQEMGFYRATGGYPMNVPIGGKLVEFTGRRTSKKISCSIAHVIQHRMISSACTLESVKFANELAAQGEHVLHLYVDGVIVRNNLKRRQWEIPRKPWQWKGPLDGYRMKHVQGYTAVRNGERIVKDPGVAHLV